MEIFYCFQCGTRIRARDLHAGAIRSADRVACAVCARTAGITPPAQAIRRPSSSGLLKTVETPSPSPRRRKILWAGAGGLAAVTVIGSLLAPLRPSTTVDPAPPPDEEARVNPPDPSEPAHPAREALEAARAYAKEKPDDLDGRIERLRRVAWENDGTPVGDEARREVEVVRAEREQRLDARLSEVDARLNPLLKASKWKEARDLLEGERARTGPPRWGLALDLRLRTLADLAVKPADSPALSPPPSPSISGAAKAAWSLACGRAFIRDYGEAERLLRESLASAEDDLTRREVKLDLDRMAAVGRLFAEARDTLRATPVGSRLVLHVWNDDGKLVRLEGRLMEARREWIVVRRQGCRLPEAVDFGDISAASWVERMSKDATSAALFCLLEGDPESARRQRMDPARIPEKYWALRPPPGPPRDALPLAAANERQARQRLAAADAKFGFLATHAEAVLAYRSLLENYGETSTVDASRARIRDRVNSSRELRIPARDLRASGNFKRSSWTSKSVEVPDCWTASEDIDWRESLENCVEIDFPALPETAYRCWVYVGGCCLESFAFHFQASEYTAKDPDSGKVVAAEPGGNFAFPLKPKGFFRSRHAQHARAGKPKQPERWQWIEVPLPEFADAGAKTVRLMTHQQGFSVACAVVSADRDAAPKDEEALEILKEPEPDVPGAPEPAQWLLLGPLPNRGFGSVDEPQRRVDLSDPEGWIPAFAQLRESGNGRAAVFDFAARYKPNENVVAFALIHARSPMERDATLLLGSDDGVEAWLNGASVHRLNRGRGVKLDEDRVEITLRAGWNRLLIKVYQGNGGWGLGARIADRSGQPMKDLTYDPWGDLPDVLR
jgi:hypothetical protein